MVRQSSPWISGLRTAGFSPRTRLFTAAKRWIGLLPAAAPRLVGLIFLYQFQSLAWASPPLLGILYPDVPPPYQNIFLNVITGIADDGHVRSQQYPLSDNFNAADVQAWLDQQHVDVVIALGRRGLSAANEAGGARPIVAGALLLTPEDEERNMVGISLAADPQPLFVKLLSLIPTIKRIHVVYDPEQNAWTMDQARKAADTLNIKVVPYRARSLREAVFYYNEIVHKAGSSTDAIWLPIDSTTVNDQVVLPLILREAWDRNLAVISNNPAHASKGALISTLPDNVALGHRLAELALRVSVDGPQPFADGSRVLPLQDLKFAVNRRTADHLGLAFSVERQRSFDFIFPAR